MLDVLKTLGHCTFFAPCGLRVYVAICAQQMTNSQSEMTADVVNLSASLAVTSLTQHFVTKFTRIIVNLSCKTRR